ncbi:LPS export ABC transporter periplasmic protein LptC [Roseofilum casamattae]|uniref:LPS export ABC transporter periplasmic protein LptC n=1 Tax=Roseofilum casamattae BLCC-M143 TaxID=3022442 RepID=A0ABT7C106_9CYAN|nr:LPS export ABC transporter periplasmic protein LptC [Roseofilum casamattae]MDJ1185126.1 LPS export ABC transporter periplasmic protein LptC [Roseofilum casamattae BLCC-M143]
MSHLEQRGWVNIGLSLICVISLIGCGGSNTRNRLAEAAAESEESEQVQLTFKDITLEQGDEEGKLLWKVYAKSATYSEDRKVAIVEQPSGELYQDGELVYRVEAKQGEVHQDGNLIILKEEIQAIAVADEVVLQGNELEWRPQADLLIVYDTLTGSHPQVEAKGDLAKLQSRSRQMELIGNVEAISHAPQLHMQTDQLIWSMEEEKLLGAVPIAINHYEGVEDKLTPEQLEKLTPTHVASAGGSVVDLKAKAVTLIKTVTLTGTTPPLEVKSESMTWDLKSQSVGVNQTVTLKHLAEQLTLVGDRGTVDLAQQVARLDKNVRMTGGQQLSDLRAEQIVWSFANDKIEATGNVTYRQGDPPLFLQGARAFGTLSDQNITVSSGDRNRVVTEIIP